MKDTRPDESGGGVDQLCGITKGKTMLRTVPYKTMLQTVPCRVTSFIRKPPPPYAPPRTLGIGCGKVLEGCVFL
jgi:hypothetical protein